MPVTQSPLIIEFKNGVINEEAGCGFAAMLAGDEARCTRDMKHLIRKLEQALMVTHYSKCMMNERG